MSDAPADAYEKSVRWLNNTGGVLSTDDVARAQFKVRGGNLVLYRKVHMPSGEYVDVEYGFAINDDWSLTVFRSTAEEGSTVCAKFV